MNFATVRSLIGQMDQKGYARQTELFAVLNSVDGARYTPTGTSIFDAVLTDDAGERQNVSLIKRGPTSNFINTRQAFSLSTKDYKGQLQYSGFWQDKKQVQQAGPQMPPPQQPRPQPQQRPQQAPQDTMSSIERQCAWKSACTVATSSGKEFTLEETLRWAGAGLKFIETGFSALSLSDPGWPDNLPLGAPREPGEDEPPAADSPY